MVGKVDYSGVPTTVDLENHHNHKKYTVNRKPDGLVISKPLCTLMGIGALLLAVLVGLLVFFFVPRCNANHENTDPPGSLTLNNNYVDDQDNSFKHSSSSSATSQLDDADERLPKTIEPTHYRIEIMPFLNNSTMSGAVTISLNIKQATNEIILHAAKDSIRIDESSVKIKSVKSNAPLSISSQEYIPSEQKYRIKVEEKLIPNIMYTLEMVYVAYLNDHLQGMYLSKYEDTIQSKQQEMTMASTQFSPTDARRAFPCFDEPSLKANFSISIAHLTNHSSMSNMPLDKTDPSPIHPNWTWDHFKTTPKMPTYLVAFLVGNLQGFGSSDKLIKTWSRHNLIQQTRKAAHFAPKILHHFESYFNTTFPLPKIDIVAVPDFGFSAMENWGLITFRESVLLLDEQDSDIDQRRQLLLVLAHEIAHQWFGNLVSPKWWNDLWLKEGFATYLQYLSIDSVEPSWKILEEFILSETSRAFYLDAFVSSRPISSSVKNNKEIRQSFDDLSYGKGACLVRMMNHFLGEETFKTGLIRFLNKYAFGSADREELFTELGRGLEEGGMSVNEVMESWTGQAGFPVVTVMADRENSKLVVSQKRFLFSEGDGRRKNGTGGGVKKMKKGEGLWWVPVSVTDDRERDFTSTRPMFWMKREPMVSVNFNFTEQWYLININMTGHYIVNYDERNWRALSHSIMSLPPWIRAQLISDSMDLARANLLDYDIPLKMISKMAVQDTNIMFVPTSVALNKLQYVNDMLSSTPAYGLFEEFQNTIFRTTYQNVDSDTDFYSTDYLKQKIRRAVLKWACRKSDTECAIRFHHLFRNWMERGLEVPANIREIVYCTAIRQGSEPEWHFAYNQYLTTKSTSQKNVLLDSLGCTTKKWLLSRYLDSLAKNSSSIKIQDSARVFESVAKNSIANTLAFDFLRMHWDELQHYYGDGFSILGKMVKSLSTLMNTEYQLNELITFRDYLKGRNSLGTTSQAFDSTIEAVRGNVEWMKKNYHNVERWLNDHKTNFNMF